MKDQATFPGGTFKLRIYEDEAALAAGKPKRVISVHNKMTNASLAAIAGLIGNTGSQSPFGYLALGTGNTAPAASQSALIAEITTSGLARQASTNSRTTTAQTNDTLSMTATWTASGSQSVQEIGIFNATSLGVMLARALTGLISVASGNIVTATYTWQAVGN